MTARAGLVILALAGCGSPRHSHMYPAGTERDDGYGDLAEESARLSIGGSDAPLAAHRGHRRPRAGAYGGDPYGGAADPDDADTDATNGLDLSAPTSHYTPELGLTGAIEGRVTWRGAPPPPLTTACGAVEAPGVRIAADRGVAGVLVYIEHVDVGRTLPTFGRPASVGGIVAKRGCALGPVVQILTPLPAELAIHGDTTEARLRVSLPGGARLFELQPAGRVVVPAQPGVTRIESDDGSLGAAWVIASDTPYYAITDDRGRFRIDELAAGSYQLTFWRPPAATLAGGKLVYGAPVVVHRAVRVDATHPARLDLALP